MNPFQPDEKSRIAESKIAPTVGISPSDQSSNEYFQAVEKKKHAFPYCTGSEVIRALLRQNVFRTRAVLYKDYINYRQTDTLANQTQMQLHIDQYMQAMQSHNQFLETECKRGSWNFLMSGELNKNVISWAAHLAIIEEYETLERTNSDAARRKNLEFAKQEASKYYPKLLIDLDKSIAADILETENYSIQEDNFDWDAFGSRMKMAIFGAFSLLAPMLIMTLHPTKLTALLTTTVFVIAVALILAISMKTAENKDVIVATAGYTAVLVVFVGTANVTGGPSDSVIGAIVAGVVLGSFLLYLPLSFILTKIMLGRLEQKFKKDTKLAEDGIAVNFFQNDYVPESESF